ncbi:hypothetical protein [Streptomyces umbrinus]|uniref:hypothetical protein n=1 Tax=Streptomyces umbrinus TaxID=67370 RepID=UPI003412F8C1
MSGQAVTVFPGVRLLYCGDVTEVVALEGLAATLRNERTGEFSTLSLGRLAAYARCLDEGQSPDTQNASVLLANLTAAARETAGASRARPGGAHGLQGRAPGRRRGGQAAPVVPF